MNRLKFICCFLSLFLLVGCSIRTDFYIQNLTEKNHIIKIKYNYSVLKENDDLIFEFINKIVSPKSFENAKNLQALNKQIINDSTIVIELPKLSTIRIERGRNYSWLHYSIDSIEIKGDKISIQEIASKSKKIKYDYIYKIEN